MGYSWPMKSELNVWESALYRPSKPVLDFSDTSMCAGKSTILANLLCSLDSLSGDHYGWCCKSLSASVIGC